MKKRILALATLLVLLLTGCGTSAEDPAQWPERSINIQVAYSAGGTSDTANRQLAALMSPELGQSFSIMNVTGGSGSIAGQQVYAAAHDGYTWLGDVAHTVSGWRTLDYADLGWENFYGFYAATSPFVLFVSSASPYETAEDLFAAMEKDPSMKWANAGLGSVSHLTGQLLLDTMGLKGNSVPYNGGRDAAVKVMAKEVTWSWFGISDIMDLAESGDIRVLGVCAPDGLTINSIKGEYVAPSLLTNYPELSQLQDLLYWGFRISRNTDPQIVKKIDEAFEKAVATPEWAEFCASKGLEPVNMTGSVSDEMCARLESIYAWGLYDIKMSNVDPASLEIPRIEDFKFPANDRVSNAQAWPE